MQDVETWVGTRKNKYKFLIMVEKYLTVTNTLAYLPGRQ